MPIFVVVMGYPLFIARRLSLSENGEKRSPAITVAIIAVALSIAVMILSISVVLGFKNEITEKVLGFNAHMSMTVDTDIQPEDNLVSLTPSLEKILDEEPYIKDYFIEVSMPAILKTPDNFKGIYLKSLQGVNSKKFLENNLESGYVPDFNKDAEREKIVISDKAARQLGLKAGEKINVYFLSDQIRVRNLLIAGVFNSHFDAYDDIFVYGSLSLIDELASLPEGKGTTIKIYTDNFNNIEEYTSLFRQRLSKAFVEGEVYRPYRVENARTNGASYMHWLDLLDMNVLVILILMTLVAAITLISGLLIIILDKIRFIGLMKALGATNSSLRKIFVFLSIKITIIGAIVGNAIGLGIILLQKTYHLIPLNPDNYYMDYVPVEINWLSILILNVAVIFIIYLTLILPSYFVAKISPANTVKYE